MFVSTLRAHLPARSLTFFITGATGGYPCGVPSPSPLRDRAASDQGPGHFNVLTGRRCTAAPNAGEQPTPHVPQPLLRRVRCVRASLPLYRL